MPSNGIRKRSKGDKQKKALRCLKCGTLMNRHLKRCKVCSKLQPVPRRPKKKKKIAHGV